MSEPTATALKSNDRRTFSSILDEYVFNVLSGRIAACKWVRLACERHKRDIRRSKEDGFPYYFDAKRVERACGFVSNMRHTKAEWAGRKIVLEPWQVFFIGSVFGWIHKETRRRRFREACLFVPRKNGKSIIAAGIGNYMLVADGEPGAEVYAGATSLSQAMEVFRPAWLMVHKDERFKEHFGLELGGTVKNPGPIYRLSDGSRFEAVIGKPGDGASPSCGIVDEYHEHKSSDLYDTFITGMGARKQPLLLITTTAGVDTSVPCYDKQKEIEKVLEGSVEREELFGVIYTIDEEDDWKDFSCWVKANPNYGVSIYAEALEQRFKVAISNPSQKNVLLTKHVNIWQNAGQAWMDMLKWGACANPTLDISQFLGQDCWIGMDLASRIDIAALRIVFQNDGEFTGFGLYYLPSETIQKPENDHYRKYVAEGWLTETDGATTDFAYIERDLENLCAKFNVRELAYDPKEANYFIMHLQEQPWCGFDCVEIPQGAAHISEPMKAFEGLVYSGQYHHNDDPVMNWMIGNVVRKQARGGGPIKVYYPTKQRDKDKIDGPVAEIMALSRAIVAQPPESNDEDILLDW